MAGRATHILSWLLLALFCACESPPAAPPVPPVASAGADLRARVGETVVLDGSDSSDPEEETLSYAWVQVGGPTAVGIADADGPWATVAPGVAGAYVFRLTVTDEEGVSASDEVHLLVLAAEPGNGGETGDGDDGAPVVNSPPRAHAGRDLQVEVGETAVLDGGASFDEEGELSYAWVQVGGPTAVGIADADSPWGTVAPQVAGEYAFRLTVTDEDGVSASDEVKLVVAPSSRGGTLRISGAPIPRQVVRVEYLIVAADLDTLHGALIVTDDLVARKTLLGIEAGADRLVELYAYDSRERLVAFGSALTRVDETRTVEVEVPMQALLPELGEIEVEAVFEEGGG